MLSQCKCLSIHFLFGNYAKYLPISKFYNEINGGVDPFYVKNLQNTRHTITHLKS